MAILKTPVYITLSKASYESKPKVVGASSTKPSTSANVTVPRVVLKVEVEVDDSLFDPIIDTNAVISVGGKPTAKQQTRVSVEPENVIAGLREINKSMKKI